MVITLFFLAIFLITVTLVVLRYGFNSSIMGGNEAMNYLFIYTTALGAAVSVGKNSHISISFFVDMLPENGRRILMILNNLLVGIFNCILVAYSFAWIQSAGGFESPVMHLPTWVVKISVPIGCILAVFYCFFNIIVLARGDAVSEG